MTINEMLIQGNVLNLFIMGIIFVIMIILISIIGNGIAARSAGDKEQPAAPSIQRAGNDAVTAAISAAVNEHRKNNKS
ncbi:MAG: sodium pump decarboxylase subunit gamma [Treponema sp.]|jgi:Na+-transporting methylmalonyl-CoA/oxaloacetate decarboxylase gamma subunit|nr:sodium pump decarboxylase subunit gamma [Treponema sp.]